MYGTIAFMHVEPEHEAALLALQDEYGRPGPKGMISEVVYRLDGAPGRYAIAVAFETKDAYEANARDPVQHTLYERFRALMSADPEWHDGEIIWSNSEP